ncbi:hypothetical protein [Streptomyces flavofungini]|uniref:hypothetical protein n=1 Tax=Streptomyces flavofungini TaxID=68200 RepID=UPI0034DE170B
MRTTGTTGTNTLLWSASVPVVTLAGTLLGLYTWMWIGIVCTLAAAAAAAIVAGGVWHRAGAAVVATGTTMALGLFGASTLHEGCLKRFGERVDAVVVDTGQHTNAKGTELDICRVVDTSGAVQDLGNTENCYGQFKPKQHVVLYKDPLGGMASWVEATDDRGLEPISLWATGGLSVLTPAALGYAGTRRLSDAESDAKRVRRSRRNRAGARTSTSPR